MTPEIGHFALALALAMALIQSVIPMIGASRRNLIWMRSARATSTGQLVLVGIAFAALMYSFFVSDFTVVNVAENSNSLQPMMFKLAVTWGSHEGSLLLWIFILTVFGAGVAHFGSNIPDALKARTLSVQTWISVGFLSFLLFTSNPFDRVFPPPLDGSDLNPLLQDIGLVMHPPLLYFGYVGFSIVFSFAVAALIEGRVDTAWARWVRPWTLAAWISLTAGIAVGSWWAFYELGWGGWWFWDPVENVSFMPWLLGTALLHSAIVTEKRAAFKSWTILLAVSIGRSLALFAWRALMMEPGGLFKPISREARLLFNNMILATATGTVLFGTLYPLFFEALTGGEKISVGPPFFNAAFVPMMLPLVFAMALGPLLSWKRADLAGIFQRLKFVAVLSVLATLAIWYRMNGGPVLGYLSILLAFWLLFATMREWAGRIRLFEIQFADALRRARNLPRASHPIPLHVDGACRCCCGHVGYGRVKCLEIGTNRICSAGDRCVHCWF